MLEQIWANLNRGGNDGHVALFENANDSSADARRAKISKNIERNFQIR